MTSILRKRLQQSEPAHPVLQAFEEFAPLKVPEVTRVSCRPWPSIGSETRGGSDEARSDVPRPLAPPPGWKCLAVDLPQIRIGFMLFGVTLELVEEAVSLVEHRQVRSRDFTPVFITDVTALEAFRSRGYVVEYIPKQITQNAANRQAERHYLSERLALIRAKWNLHKLVDLAQSSP